MALYVGIDGGGTRSAAVVVDGAGEERARVTAGAALVRAADPAAGAAALADLVVRALGAAGAHPPAAGLCCALAGAGRVPERTAVAGALVREAVATRVLVTTDAEAAFHDAFGEEAGLLLIAGTGSIAWGRAVDGRVARAGGWGALLGDEGSGYALGLGALRAVARAHDGRGPRTALLERVLEAARAEAPEELIAWSGGAAKAEIAALAPVVFAAAEAGDAVARGLITEAARALAGHLEALGRALGPWSGPAPAAFAGGLLGPGGPLRAAVLAELGRGAGAPIQPLADREVDAARGAAALARQAALTIPA